MDISAFTNIHQHPIKIVQYLINIKKGVFLSTVRKAVTMAQSKNYSLSNVDFTTNSRWLSFHSTLPARPWCSLHIFCEVAQLLIRTCLVPVSATGERILRTQGGGMGLNLKLLLPHKVQVYSKLVLFSWSEVGYIRTALPLLNWAWLKWHTTQIFTTIVKDMLQWLLRLYFVLFKV